MKARIAVHSRTNAPERPSWVNARHTNPPIYSLQYPGALLAVIRACEMGTIAS